ncbi:MAG: DUF177 domain-containing protein [bacterium]|nr:DUF177 domain-containing protein [bacterium]
MKVKIVPTALGEWKETYQVSIPELELPNDPHFKVVTAEIVYNQTDRRLLMDIQLSVKASTECYHCGEPMTFLIFPYLHLEFYRVENPNRDSGDDDIKFIGLLQTDIDLSQDLRDAIVLSLPMRITCCDEDRMEHILFSGD